MRLLRVLSYERASGSLFLVGCRLRDRVQPSLELRSKQFKVAASIRYFSWVNIFVVKKTLGVCVHVLFVLLLILSSK